MNNSELNELLKRAQVPEPREGFWDQFPAQVTRAIAREGKTRQAGVSAGHVRGLSVAWVWRATIAAGMAALAVAALLFLRPDRRPADAQLATAQKYFREIHTLFPNQVKAIEFDAAGARLVLAEQPDVPASPPLYVSVCGPHGCHHFVTFSGQQIRVNGDTLDVLLDRQGEVLVVGKRWAWPDSTRETSAPYRIEARPLPLNS